MSVGQIRFVFGLLRENSSENSDAHRVTTQIELFLVTCIFTIYLVSAITRLIGMRSFFKLSRKWLSVGSSVNYREGPTFTNAVIVLHVLSFVIYLIRYSVEWIRNNYQIDFLLFHISGFVCETVTSFAAVQFLYLVFTLRLHFMLLNSRLSEIVMSTVKSEGILPSKFHTVSDVLPERYSVISTLRDILYRHLMLCDILGLIDSSYSIQILALIRSKFV
jgi:hypothetical protein